MTTITLLRKAMPNGYVSTWRFGVTADGRHVAVSNRNDRKDFASAYALDKCVEAYIKYGYETYKGAQAVVRKSAEVAAETTLAV